MIGGAEEVEEAPCGEEREEKEERERVGDERESEHGGEQGEVVDPEVGGVLPDPGGGLGEVVGSGEGGAVDKLVPRAALGEAVPDGGGQAREEGPERRS